MANTLKKLFMSDNGLDMKKKKILFVSHSSSFGGAEKALTDLIQLIQGGYEIDVLVPSSKGALCQFLRKNNIRFFTLPLGFSTPDLPKFLFDYADSQVNQLLFDLKPREYDVVISNTLVCLHGALIAKELNIPHIFWAHENLNVDVDLATKGFSPNFYIKVLSNLSSHIICGSKYTESLFNQDEISTSVLYPFTPYDDLKNNFSNFGLPLLTKVQIFLKSIFQRSFSSELTLLVIGSRSLRKNTHFSLTVLKALKLRGINAELHIVGHGGSGKKKFKQQYSIRKEKNVFFHRAIDNPYLLGGKNKINLVCATSEPFGLTVPESLFRGIPVISTRSGGPEEVLDSEYLYDVDDINGCVLSIEKVLKSYQNHSIKAKKLYEDFSLKNSLDNRKKIINDSIDLAIANYSKNSSKRMDISWSNFTDLSRDILNEEDLIDTIFQVSTQTDQSIDLSQLKKLIDIEKTKLGSSVLRDIKKFNVVPFSDSEAMSSLYKNGLGLAIELVAFRMDAGKSLMMGYILLALIEKQNESKSPIRVLFLGDGLGIDSIRIASYGFKVDYIDFDQSMMANCAKINIEKVQKISSKSIDIAVINELISNYDAVICLEVIEHLQNPKDFLKCIYDHLDDSGILLISDCFEGIYDKWPTHLYSNEKYSGGLPFLALPYFDLIDCQRKPFGKPYLFKRKKSILNIDESLSFLNNHDFLTQFIKNQQKIGV
jgi:2-polyprenyl-3-methyl-5-hydroxy-6-metoxy-1,4-benzoquinol methylase/glycosyltransferase involved in cell wall biosynthesis